MYFNQTRGIALNSTIAKVDNEILAIEAKQSNSVKKDDFKHIIDFQSRCEKKCLGVVFYNGEMVVEFEDNLVALPFGMFL